MCVHVGKTGKIETVFGVVNIHWFQVQRKFIAGFMSHMLEATRFEHAASPCKPAAFVSPLTFSVSFFSCKMKEGSPQPLLCVTPFTKMHFPPTYAYLANLIKWHQLSRPHMWYSSLNFSNRNNTLAYSGENFYFRNCTGLFVHLQKLICLTPKQP